MLLRNVRVTSVRLQTCDDGHAYAGPDAGQVPVCGQARQAAQRRHAGGVRRAHVCHACRRGAPHMARAGTAAAALGALPCKHLVKEGIWRHRCSAVVRIAL